MPDLSLIEPLCEALSISINELLNGERINAEETLKIANENMIGVLSDREREIKKRRRLTVLVEILAAIMVVLSLACSIIFSVYGPVFSEHLVAQWRGDGYSFSAAHYTRKAELVVKYITERNYEKAAQLIGFYTEDRDTAEKEWCEAMETLSDTITIKQFTASKMIEDDRFVSGNATITVYDHKSHNLFAFEMNICAQMGGIAFGGIHRDDYDDESRYTEVAHLIDDVLNIWYAG